MIKTKQDLKDYLQCDKKQLGITKKFPLPFTDEIWKYEIVLRRYEYWLNHQDSIYANLARMVYKFIFHRWCVKLCINIGPNTCGKGLCISHFGCIQINWHAKIGENLRIQEGVTVGGNLGGVPVIGNNVFLASGCKVIGEVTIPDNCVVGTNAVVVKDVEEQGITVAGVPAKKISNNGSKGYIFR